MKFSYSKIRTFLTCQRKAEWSYIENLEPVAERSNALAFGSLIHECLADWHMTRKNHGWKEIIENNWLNSDFSETAERNHSIATAMMSEYCFQYPREEFEVLEVEKEIEAPIVNPTTGKESKYSFFGIVDGLVRFSDGVYLLEHKTTSQINESYISSLWLDLQIMIYSYYVEKAIGEKIVGVLYNILQKPKQKQVIEETEEDFKKRYIEACQKNKTGKSNIKRKKGESKTQFIERIQNEIRRKNFFHREILFFSDEQIERALLDFWYSIQLFMKAESSGFFIMNTKSCWQYNRPCSFESLCRSGGSDAVKEVFFQEKKKRPEKTLKDSGFGFDHDSEKLTETDF